MKQQKLRSGSHKNEHNATIVTKIFREYMSANGGSVNLSTFCEKTQIPKRRLYDTVNVLEGAGAVEKIGRGLYRWTSNPTPEHEHQDSFTGPQQQPQKDSNEAAVNLQRIQREINVIKCLNESVKVSILHVIKHGDSDGVVNNNNEGSRLSITTGDIYGVCGDNKVLAFTAPANTSVFKHEKVDDEDHEGGIKYCLDLVAPGGEIPQDSNAIAVYLIEK